MKIQKNANRIVIRMLLLMAFGIIAIAWAPASRAGLTGPYTNDFYTLHLWHFQDVNPGTGTNGFYEFDYATNSLVNQITLTNWTTVNETASVGQPGPGTSPLIVATGTNFGYALSMLNTQDCGFAAPIDSGYPDLSYAYTNDSCSFVNTNTGAFTWEALIQPGGNMLTTYPSGDQDPEIICTDGGNSTGPGANPYTVRAVQFRLKCATPSSGQAQIEFNGNISGPSAEIHDLVAQLPTTGPDALVAGQWYHVAWAFTGTTPTNSDPPNVLTCYWTLLAPTRTNADVLANFNYVFTITNTSTHTANSLPYPSNSIIGTGPLVIGNSDRGMSGGWFGNIAEVRISDYYRHANEFMFDTNPVPAPVTISVQASQTNQLVGYGYNLTVSPLVSGSSPIQMQWDENGVPVAGQTNATLLVSNVTLAANGNFELFATNAYGHTNSVICTVAVGATFEGLFNTGCGPQNNPLDKTAPGSVDPHWQIPVDPDPTAVIPNAIVWSDGNPLEPANVVPDNGASVWIGAHENAGAAGFYTYQTTFQVDETAVSTNPTSAVLTGTVGADGTTAGTVMQMYLNGVETDLTLAVNPNENIFPFSITNGLQPGTNQLICTVSQAGAFGDGFNLEILSDTDVALTTAPAITNQPVGVTNLYGSAVSIFAAALGAPPLMYYWLSNGVAIAPPVWVGTAVPELNFVATNFSPSQLTGTNYIVNYQVIFSNLLGAATSAVATLDIQLPALNVASAGVPIWNLANNQTNIVVYFSGVVDPLTATNAGNYALDNGASVLSAALGSAPGEVILMTTVLNPATSYTLTVQNVNSVFGYTMNPSPASIPLGTYPATVALWLRADSGVTTNSDSTVAEWNDLSVNGNNFYPGVSPLYVPNALNGLPVIEFNATNGTYMTAGDTPSLEITGDMTVLAVVNFTTYSTNGIGVGQGGGEIISKTGVYPHWNIPGPYDYYVNINGASCSLLRGNGSTSAAENATTIPTTGVPHLLDVTMQGTTVTHRLDGNPNGSGTLSTTIAEQYQPVYIGTRADGSLRLDGDMAELILIAQALPASDLASMENYLAAEYALPIGPQINPNATNLVFAVTSNVLTLSWPVDHTGWTLQAQTNNLSAGLGTNWVNVAGSTGTNQVVIPVNQTSGSVFYRLYYNP